MRLFKRISLFLLVNFLVVITISIVLNLLNVKPYLSKYGINYQSLAIFCLVWGMGGAFISLMLSRWMAKMLMGVKVIDPNTYDANAKKLLEVVYGLAHKAGLKTMPEVGIFQSPEVNAFATGPSEKKSLVAVSSGLLQRMGEDELEGVIAHEISHIANGDMVTMTLLQGVVNAFVMFLARVLALIFSGFGKNEKNSSGSFFSYYLFTVLFEVILMAFGALVITAYSRYREFRADRGGASLVGKYKMILALESLQKLLFTQDPKAQTSPIAAFKISGSKKAGFLRSLFATHPPLEERIRRLKGF